jgi:hypothetical protein
LTAGLSLGGLAAIGSFFPDLRSDQVIDSVAHSQAAWQAQHEEGLGGNSDIDIGSGEARSPMQQLVFVPFALVNAFFRPMLFEARGLPMIGAAVENTLLMLAVASLLRAGRRRLIVPALIETPLLVFAVAFCFVFGVGVGLATGNLGSLSRYRVPMMPFYATVVLVLRQRQKAAAAATIAASPARLGARRVVRNT